MTEVPMTEVQQPIDEVYVSCRECSAPTTMVLPRSEAMHANERCERCKQSRVLVDEWSYDEDSGTFTRQGPDEEECSGEEELSFTCPGCGGTGVIVTVHMPITVRVQFSGSINEVNEDLDIIISSAEMQDVDCPDFRDRIIRRQADVASTRCIRCGDEREFNGYDYI